MQVRQFFVEHIAHSSYLLGWNGGCAIVDPARDAGMYVEAASDMGLPITHVLETHLHADFVSGHTDLADATGAAIVAPAAGSCSFDHIPVRGGDRLDLGELRVEVIDTPGHTPEHVSYVVTDVSRGGSPAAVFCGDTLFVGDAGRPDLFPGMAGELASRLFDSLHEGILALPDHCIVFPAHGAGSLCGSAIGSMRWSSVGYERVCNPLLSLDRDSFVTRLTEGMPPVPDHFARCSSLNAAGPVPVRELPDPLPMGPGEFLQRIEGGAVVLDARRYESFGGMHVPCSINIDITGSFPVYCGWLLPPDRDLVLVAESPGAVRTAVAWLRKVGLDRTVGFLEGGLQSWAASGMRVGRLSQMSAAEALDEMRSGRSFALVDTRPLRERTGSEIRGAIAIEVQDLRHPGGLLDPGTPTAVLCSSGRRSSIGASFLLASGFERVSNVAGGISAMRRLPGFEAAVPEAGGAGMGPASRGTGEKAAP